MGRLGQHCYCETARGGLLLRRRKWTCCGDATGPVAAMHAGRLWRLHCNWTALVAVPQPAPTEDAAPQRSERPSVIAPVIAPPQLDLPLPRLLWAAVQWYFATALTEAQVSYCTCPYRGSSQLLHLPLPRLKSVIAPALTEAAQVSYCAARRTSLDSES
jgi:hypothetical protein